MRNKILSMLLIGLLFLPASLAHAMVDPLSTVQVEIPEMNLQFLMPRAWDGYLLEAEAASATLVFVDPDDTMLQRVIMVLTFSKTEALDDELTAYRAEADALFASGEGQTMRLLSSGVLDRMDAIDAGADGGAYRVLFIDAGGGYIAIVYQDPQHVADDGYTAAVDTILGSVAQMDNAMAARPEPSDAFLVEPREGGVAISAYVGEALRVDVPEEIDGQKVVAIAERAFFEKPVQHVWLPEGIAEIGAHAFSGCTNLRTITLPSSLAAIGDAAFETCLLLQRISLPEGLETIGANAFWSCMQMKEIALSPKLSSIGRAAFGLTQSLRTVLLPESNVSYRTVSGVLLTADWETLVLYPAGLEESSYAVPDGVQHIAEYAFAYADALVEVTLPGTAESIGAMAFTGVYGLERIVIPPSVTEISPDAFPSAPGLIISGDAGSAAEAFAMEQGLMFEDRG